jgi:DNA (cytosine-5)-methyltransferase 1
MTHGSLFSGIGGFDLAARWMGWENAFHVERDPFCRQVLTHHFPKSKSYDDIKEFDATPFRGRVQIISGGFPCQPFSAAGKRGGTSDDRYLWPEMFRVVREVRPTWVVAENVRGLLSWNDGLVLDTVCADLEGQGYEVFPTVLPAAGVSNCPHKRDRIWIVATNASGVGRQRRGSEEAEGRQGERPWVQPHPEGQGSGGNAPDPNGQVLEHGDREGETRRATEPPIGTESPCSPRGWEAFPTFPPVCGGDDGLPRELDGITFPRWRKESIKAYGNAIVPQVAYQIFRAIQQS